MFAQWHLHTELKLQEFCKKQGRSKSHWTIDSSGSLVVPPSAMGLSGRDMCLLLSWCLVAFSLLDPTTATSKAWHACVGCPGLQTTGSGFSDRTPPPPSEKHLLSPDFCTTKTNEKFTFESRLQNQLPLRVSPQLPTWGKVELLPVLNATSQFQLRLFFTKKHRCLCFSDKTNLQMHVFTLFFCSQNRHIYMTCRVTKHIHWSNWQQLYKCSFA